MDGSETDNLSQLPPSSVPNTSSLNQSGSNDFVKKLFQMLQDDTYKDVVKWTTNGDLFVVINTNEFTKEILPRHFKHSNFASFVRQLNKYDFHKVKIPNEEKHNYEYGGDAWEFKHPDFRINDRDALENIKRKGPTSKKSSNILPNGVSDQLSEEVALLKQDFKSLIDENKLIKQELSILQTKYKAVVENIVNLKQIDERNYRSMGVLINTLVQAGIKVPPLDFPNPNLAGLLQPSTSTQASPPQSIQQAQINQVLGSSAPLYDLSSYPIMAQLQAPPQVQHKRVSGDLTQPQNASQNQPQAQLQPGSFMEGNEISASPQITNLNTPSSVKIEERQRLHPPPTQPPPASGVLTTNNGAQAVVSPTPTSSATTTTTNIPNPKFYVLLVEDDNVCIQLCRKFLVKYGCQVTVATDGLNAIQTVENFRYDLVLMDIVMPNLDGATATSIIRSFDQKTPIIAMTGNVEEHDLVTYLNNGMSDILAKPFTKDDLYSMLQKHLLINQDSTTTNPANATSSAVGPLPTGIENQSPMIVPPQISESSENALMDQSPMIVPPPQIPESSDNALMDVMGAQAVKKQRLQ